MKKFKILSIFFFSFLLVVLFNSCNKDNSSKSIDDLIQYFSKNFQVSSKSEKLYQMIGAIDGCGIKINGNSVEIYKFDINDKGSKNILKNIESTNTFTVLGMTFPAIVNGSFVLSSYNNHPDKDKIIESFSNF